MEKEIQENRRFIDQKVAGTCQFEREKGIFDQKVKDGKFANIAKNKKEYDELIQQIDETNQKMKFVFDKVNELLKDVVQIKKTTEQKIQSDLI